MSDTDSRDNLLSLLLKKVHLLRPAEIRFALANARDVFWNSIMSFMNNGDANQAAAIAFYAILSVIPLLMLSAVAAGFFFGSQQSAQTEVIKMIREFHPYISEQFLAETGRLEEKSRVLGWVGLVSLIWFSSLIFNSIETAFSLIFRSRSTRSYFKSKLLGISMIPLGWTVGLASVLITYFARLIAGNPWIAKGGWMADLLVHGFLFTYVIPYAVMVIFFTVVYKIIPTEKLSFGNALAAGSLCAALMEVAKHVFTWYLANYGRYDLIYGPLDTIVIMVIWVFYVSSILLFCAELISSYRLRALLLLEKAIMGLSKGSIEEGINARLFRRFGKFYAKGDYICREGEESREIFYILMGRVQVEKKTGQTVKPLVEMGQGQYFGEMAALIDSPRSASVRALTDCDIAVIDAGTFRELLRHYGTVSLFILREMSSRVKNTTKKLGELSHDWLKVATVLYLLKEWPFDGEKDFRSELAGLTGKDPHDINEILKELAALHILDMEGGRIRDFRKENIWGIMSAVDIESLETAFQED